MKKVISVLLSIWIVALMLLPGMPAAQAREELPELTKLIRNGDRRRFVTSMLSFYLSENTAVQNALEEGYSAVFLFDGCSDNMDDPKLSDLSYYRVSAVCIVLRLGDTGTPEIVYFNDACSTLPDRPLDYGQWQLEEVGDVGPATVCDGTYELYSVYHMGSYEALHMRTSYVDQTAVAVYMTPEGYVTHPATHINIHTRTGNHILQEAMWSAGCMLVGDGDFSDFEALIDATYYSGYEEFLVDRKVGTVTINRLLLRDAMEKLYAASDAVNTILTSSRCEDPRIYMERCTAFTDFPQSKLVKVVRTVELMSLPCETETDSRSIPAGKLSRGSKVDICGSVVNTEGELWYEVELLGNNSFIKAADVKQTRLSLWDRFIEALFN